ncbi:MAG: hypothetical protein RMJ55_08810 [Roseiflexaceae bacterium]|nr:hypothetical protein [Roseiflexaceae bacterium]
MNLLHKYWRWLALIALVVVLTNSRALPWPLVTLIVGAAAVYLLREGWIVWRRAGGPPTRSKVTYRARSASKSDRRAPVRRCPTFAASVLPLSTWSPALSSFWLP